MIEISVKWFWRIFIAWVVIAVCVILAKGQIKFGDITVPDSVAKEYFLDCWKHPDVVYNHSIGEIQDHDYMWYVDRRGKRHDVLDTLSYGWKTVRVRRPNVDDFARWFLKEKR